MNASGNQAATHQDRVDSRVTVKRGRPARKRAFLGAASLTVCLVYGVGLLGFWGLHPRLQETHRVMAEALGVVLLLASLGLLGAVGVVAASLKLRRAWRLSEWVAGRLVSVAPWMRPMARLMRVSGEEFQASLDRVRQELSRQRLRQSSSGRVLCVVSQEMPARLRRNLRNVCAEWELELVELSPWTDVRELILKVRPSGVLFVGCELGSGAGLEGLGYELPVREISVGDGESDGTGCHLDLAEVQDQLAELKSGRAVGPTPVRS